MKEKKGQKENVEDYLKNTIFSVSSYLTLIGEILSPLIVSIRGEVCSLKVLEKWVFFELSDEAGGILSCGMHKSKYRSFDFLLEEGLEIIVYGKSTVFNKKSSFTFWIQDMKREGEGYLEKKYRELKKLLEKEGLYFQKRALPLCVSDIVLITSLNGVVIEDFKKNLLPFNIRVRIINSLVEGEGAVSSLLSALSYAFLLKPECIIIIRGGGSFESLYPFNNEKFARLLYSSPVPTLLGVGHDTDMPIATFVSDYSASTPTGVAHLINENWREGISLFETSKEKIHSQYEKNFLFYKKSMREIFHSILFYQKNFIKRGEKYEREMYDYISLCERLLYKKKNILFSHTHNFISAYKHLLKKKNDFVLQNEKTLYAYHPERILEKGYSIVFDSSKKVVRSVEKIKKGQKIETRFFDGTLSSIVEKKEEL